MKQYIDTHVHLYDEGFGTDLEEVIFKARQQGIISFILPGIDIASHESLLSVSAKYPEFIYPATGLHPTSVKDDWEKELEFVFERAEENKYCAIGEIGMDGYWTKEFIKEQAVVFQRQVELAASKSLPVIIHAREATEDIFSVLEKTKHLGITGVFHAFSGSFDTFKRIQKYGDFKIGIGGVVTYKNSTLPATLEKIGLENIILETDAPWLTPVPFRGKRNEPSYIPIIAEKVAAAKGCSLDEVAEITTINSMKLFNLNI